MIRQAAVAGKFYPRSKGAIEDIINGFAGAKPESGKVFGLVAPHAGYIYSGMVAAKVYASARVEGSLILIGPNHGMGRGYAAPPVSAMTKGKWDLPTGEMEIDERLALRLMEFAPMIADAAWAHESEHSLEVQLPFIQHFMGGLRFVPIIISHIPDEEVMALAEGIEKGIRVHGAPVTLGASTDFSHYIPADTAKRLDRFAIERIEALDAPGLLETVREHRITMCGAQATAVVIEVCRKLGATRARLVEYRTSGDVTGDNSSVVGYGGFVIE